MNSAGRAAMQQIADWLEKLGMSEWTGAATDATFSDRAAASNEGRAYDLI